ncbi:hypothetical protein [Bradyrhizobium sp. LA6.12]|uniref:hypothetical protein n=1 Tax=unclassified Bradyrhizobium TaxID=2631580 RepID=UPI00339226EA
MPLFKKSDCPPEMPDEILWAVNQCIDDLQAKLVDQVILAEPPLRLGAPNLARCFMQAHLRRMLMFVEGGYAEFHAGRPLMTEMASRALYENVATLCDYSTKLQELCAANNYAGVNELTQKYTFSTRLPHFLETNGPAWKAPQILNQIDKMNKRNETYRSAYDHLCEIVHPNGLGAVVYFARNEDGLMTFQPRGAVPERAMESLVMAAILFLTVFVELDEMEKSLAALTAGTEAK